MAWDLGRILARYKRDKEGQGSEVHRRSGAF